MAGYPLAGFALRNPSKVLDSAYLIASAEIVNDGDLVGFNGSNVVVATNGAGTVGNIVKPVGMAFFDVTGGTESTRVGDGTTVEAAIARRGRVGPMTSSLVPGLAAGLPVYLGVAPLPPQQLSALTAAGAVATATVATTDGLITGQSVTVAGAVDPVAAMSVSALSQTGGTASATVVSTTGIVVGQQVLISGASPTAYNGLKTVLSVSGGGATIVTFAIAAGTAASATGTITLTPVCPYNGAQTITVTGGTQFTFAVPSGTAPSPLGTITETPPLVSNYTCTLPVAGEALVQVGIVDADGVTLLIDMSPPGSLEVQSAANTNVKVG